MGARSGKALPDPVPAQLHRRLQEGLLPDRLNGLEGRAGRRQGSRVGLRVGELEDERYVDPLDVGEADLREERLARTGPAEGDHVRLVLDLRLAGQCERTERPCAGRRLDVAPHGEPHPAARDQDPVDLGQSARGRAPDAAEAGDDVEGAVLPRQGVHVPHPQVGVGVAVPGDGEEARRGIDAGAPGAAHRRQLHRQAGAARDVEQAIAGAQAQAVVDCDVFPAVRRFGEGGELDGPSAPALVDDAPLLRRPGAGFAGSSVTAAPGRRGPGIDGELGQAAQHEAVAVPPVQVLRRDGEGELWEPPQERAEREVALHAGQRRAEAVVHAVPEGEMTGHGPVDVERLGARVSSASRLAAARQMITCAPAGMVTPPSSTGSTV